MTSAIICSDLTFAWPDGVPVLSGLTVSFGPGRTGLIGVNGSGKSTLLRLIAGELRPGSGTVRTDGEVGYLPQAITLGTHRSVSDLLGITAARDALHAIEAGETGEQAFAAVGDDWDVEERARAWLDRLGLASLGLDDRVERLSGGETILAALAALFLRRPDILLLDEPTNGLDPAGRNAMLELIAKIGEEFGISIVVASHLLGEIERICDHLVAIEAGRLLRADTIDTFTKASQTLVVEVEEGLARLERELTRRGLRPRAYQRSLLVPIGGDDTYDAVRDSVADLGLPLSRLERRRHQVEELFRDDTADVTPLEAADAG